MLKEKKGVQSNDTHTKDYTEVLYYSVSFIFLVLMLGILALIRM